MSLIIVAALLALLWLWLGQLSRQNQQHEPDLPQAASPGLADIPSLPVVWPVGQPDREVAPPKAPAGAISGETTLIFGDPAEMEAFLAGAEENGFKVLGVIKDLGAVRLSGSPAAFRDLLGDQAEVDYNYTVEAPSLPDPEFWMSNRLRPFRFGLLSFLGIAPGTDLSTWGTGVTVAVLDTGWTGNSAVNPNQISVIDLVGGDLGGDLSGHGTAVAGLIGSADLVAPGLAPASELLAIRVLDSDGAGNAFTLAQGILVAVQNGADIINMSLGGYGDSSVLRAAVAFAASQGVVLVGAAGNDGLATVTYPAAYDDVIAVSGVDANGNHVPFSNYGSAIDIAAPGFQVSSIWGEEDLVLLDGTSASAPLVSAVAARVLQLFPDAGPEDVRAILLGQANEKGLPGHDVLYGAGVLNVDRIENLNATDIYDIALADLYPAVELTDGATFPLYVSVENRGSEYIPQASVEVTVNGRDYYYRFSGLVAGAVDSVQIPISRQQLEGGRSVTVIADIQESDSFTDFRPSNNAGKITISLAPEE